MSQTLETQGLVWNWISQPSNRWWVTLVVLIVFAVGLGVVMQSNQQHFCSLFDGYEVTPAEKHRILIALGNANLNVYEVRGDQILVPTNEKAKYLATIDDEQAMPLIYQQRQDPKPNLFLPRSQQAMMEQNRKKRQVREMVLRLPFVREAWFEIDWAESNSAFRKTEHSAVVLIRTAKQDVLNRQQVQTIQGLVAGAIAGLQPHEVVVTDANIGVSYHNLDERRQSELIEQVTWKMGRRQHYHERLQHLMHEYPGMELEIEVERSADGAVETEDVIASEVPAKFAGNLLPTSNRLPAQRMRLNGGGSVYESEQPDQFKRDLYVSRASFDQPAISRALRVSEAVRIQVRLPDTTIRNHLFSVEVNGGEAERYEILKSEITSKIKAIVPVSVLDASAPIMFVRDSCGVKPVNQSNVFAKVFKEYWPFAALALLGYTAIVFSRSGQPVPEETSSRIRMSSEEQSPTLDEAELQSQLASLIDSHPEAAAEVLKNWIRDSK